nr:RagB/SusD family nutrient uptake outer membrane protein [uncultured Bacteroides sp.]
MKLFKLTTILLLTASFLFSSCGEDYITVDPTDVATGDQIDKLAKDNPEKLKIIIDPLLAGIYNYLNQYNTQGSTKTVHNDFGLMSIFHLGDVMNDDLAFHVQGSGWFTYDYQLDYRAEQYTRTYQYWNFFYTIINKANTVISKIPADVTDADIKAIKGQVLALRGMSYYYLINMYQQTYSSLSDPSKALGVPLIYTTAEGQSRLNRVPVKEVYEQLEKDLLNAIDLLAGYQRPSKTNINKEVAQILLSRAYLTEEKWAEAASMAHEARINSTAQLMSASEVAKDGFNNISNKEWMWGADITAETSTKFASLFSFICTFDAGYGGAVGQYRKIDAKLYSNFSSSDARLALFKSPNAIVDANSSDVTVKCPAYTNLKFKKVTGWEADYVFMRLSEAYLTEAEALAHQGKNADAAQVLKELMANRDPSWNQSSVTVDDVYTQRRLELWGEGFSFFDHLRLKKDIVRNYQGSNHWSGGLFNVTAGDWKLLYQVPRRELQENEQIKSEDQNP